MSRNWRSKFLIQGIEKESSWTGEGEKNCCSWEELRRGRNSFSCAILGISFWAEISFESSEMFSEQYSGFSRGFESHFRCDKVQKAAELRVLISSYLFSRLLLLSFRYAKPSGLILSLLVVIVYAIALRFEG